MHQLIDHSYWVLTDKKVDMSLQCVLADQVNRAAKKEGRASREKEVICPPLLWPHETLIVSKAVLSQHKKDTEQLE